MGGTSVRTPRGGKEVWLMDKLIVLLLSLALLVLAACALLFIGK